MQLVDLFRLERVGLGAAAPRLELRRPVVPDAKQACPLRERLDGRNPRPALGTVDQSFLQALAEDVAKTRNLALTVGDDDRPIAARPKGAIPMMVTPDLLGDVRGGGVGTQRLQTLWAAARPRGTLKTS